MTQIHEFFVTFGVQYPAPTSDWYSAEDAHPLGMHADGYAVIEAPTLDTARDLAAAVFGKQWAFIYPYDLFIADGTKDRWHPAGELLRIGWKGEGWTSPDPEQHS